jgi:hypothetical protein
MKTHSPLLCGVSLGLTALILLAPISAKDKAAPADDTTAKPYVLFMGADLAVQRDKKFHRVEDVIGSELKIRIGKKEFFVPTRNRATGLKVSHSLKLTGATAQLDGLAAGPAYTPAKDPRLKFARESGAAGGAAAVQDQAYGRMIAKGIDMAVAGQNAEYAKGSSFEAAAAKAYEEEQAKFQQSMDQAGAASDMMRSSQFNTGQYADNMQRELAEGNYDAMEVSFKISSPVELDDPYMVILFKFQARDAKPGDESMLIHAESLDPIGPKPKYIRVRQGGLPEGFKFLDSKVHIFNRGEEVATNTSAKRVELTREEAQQYLIIEHLGANKDATVPAAVVPGTLASTRLKELTLDQQNRTYYAKVGPDGAVLGLFADESCNLKIDNDTTLAVVSEVFFKPALVKGKPVEGVARVRLGEI